MSEITLTNEQADELYSFTSESGGAEIRSAYSGRGMYGKTCVGIVIDNEKVHSFLVKFGFFFGERNEFESSLYEVYDSFLNLRMDTMGRDSTIIYFPDISWPEDIEP